MPKQHDLAADLQAASDGRSFTVEEAELRTMPLEKLAVVAARWQKDVAHEEAVLKEMKRKRALVFEALVERMVGNQVDGQSEPMQNITASGMTMYVDRRLVAQARCEHVDLCDALEKAGFGKLIQRRVNAQTLNAWLNKDLDRDEFGNPIFPLPEMYDLIECREIVQLRARSA